jgi:hypothetical protein
MLPAGIGLWRYHHGAVGLGELNWARCLGRGVIRLRRAVRHDEQDRRKHGYRRDSETHDWPLVPTWVTADSGLGCNRYDLPKLLPNRGFRYWAVNWNLRWRLGPKQ